MNNKLLYDSDVWSSIDVEDLWVYDKLILCKKLGYICGPAGVQLPYVGKYIVKPITNILGMGVGTEILDFTTTNTDHLNPGTFWMEIFYGRHITVDVVGGNIEVVYEGIQDGTKRFSRWTQLSNDAITVPEFVINLSKKYGVVNYESIGDKIIEVHLRGNPDWIKHRAKELIPIWEGQEIPSENFVEDKDIGRLGFKVIK